MVQSVRAFALQAEGWVSESQPRQFKVVLTGVGCPNPNPDRSKTLKLVVTTSLPNAKCECQGSTKMTIINGRPRHRKCHTLKSPYC